MQHIMVAGWVIYSVEKHGTVFQYISQQRCLQMKQWLEIYYNI